MEWIHLTHDMVQRSAVPHTVMWLAVTWYVSDLLFPDQMSNLRESWEITSYCRHSELTLRLLMSYTGCPRRNVPDFGRAFLMLKYTTQNTYVHSWTVTEIMARKKCGLLAGPRTVPVSWQVLSMFVLECGVRYGKSAHTSLIPECAVSHVTSVLAIHVSCIVLGTLRTTMTCVRVFL